MASASRRLPLFILFSLCYLSSGVAHSQEAPSLEEMLVRVADALRNTSYRGRLTYEHSGQLDLVEVVHGVNEDMAFGRVDYLNGPHRKLARQAQRRDCAIGNRLLAGDAVERADGKEAALNGAYDYHMLGVDSVAGRPSWVLQLVPKDEHRHGFIFAVDQSSYLPTKVLYLSLGNKVLERLHFVSLETGVPFDPANFAGLLEASGTDLPACEGMSNETPHWQPRWVPDGFVRAHYQYSEADGHMETYTDGLASFSVFTKKATDAAGVPARGFTKGATVIVMAKRVDLDPPVSVAVLGEIPKTTANRILSSVDVR